MLTEMIKGILARLLPDSGAREKLRAYLEAAGFERVDELMEKPPDFFRRMGEVVRKRTEELGKRRELTDPLHDELDKTERNQ